MTFRWMAKGENAWVMGIIWMRLMLICAGQRHTRKSSRRCPRPHRLGALVELGSRFRRRRGSARARTRSRAQARLDVGDPHRGAQQIGAEVQRKLLTKALVAP